MMRGRYAKEEAVFVDPWLTPLGSMKVFDHQLPPSMYQLIVGSMEKRSANIYV
jgi:hypothetical protein